MKVTFLVAALCVAVASGLSKEAVTNAVKKCAQSTKAPPATLINLIKIRKIPETQEEKCLMGCFYKEIGISKDGALNYELVKGVASLQYAESPEHLKKAIEVIDSCKSIKSHDDCILGYKLRECFIKNSDDRFTPFLETLRSA